MTLVEPHRAVRETLAPLGGGDGGSGGHNEARESSRRNGICCRGLETGALMYVIMTTGSRGFHCIKQSIG